MKALMRLREQFKHPESGTEIWNSDQACVTAGKEKASKQASKVRRARLTLHFIVRDVVRTN
jgi:hypothetical protein